MKKKEGIEKRKEREREETRKDWFDLACVYVRACVSVCVCKIKFIPPLASASRFRCLPTIVGDMDGIREIAVHTTNYVSFAFSFPLVCHSHVNVSLTRESILSNSLESLFDVDGLFSRCFKVAIHLWVRANTTHK